MNNNKEKDMDKILGMNRTMFFCYSNFAMLIIIKYRNICTAIL